MEYNDIIRIKQEVGIYKIEFLLWKKQWDSYIEPNVDLSWKCVKFEEKSSHHIPDEKGIYALTVEPRLASFPSIRYLMYIGQAGHNSEGNLKKRFGNYINEKKRVKRDHINYLLNTWEDNVFFYFAVIDPNETNIKELEQKLLDTFIPPMSKNGYSAKIGRSVRILEI